ncbi:MAG: type II secretion system protein GspM [Myxococcota bacterium]
MFGGLTIGVAFVALRGVPWMIDRYAAMRTIALERQAMWTRASEVLASREAVRDSLGRVVSEIIGLAPKLIDGTTPAEAQATLAALVGMAAGRQALKVVRLDPLPDSAAGVFHRVALHAELEGDLGGIARLLRVVETATPLLSVTSLTIAAPEPASPPQRPEILRVELQAAGYYLPREARSESEGP